MFCTYPQEIDRFLEACVYLHKQFSEPSGATPPEQVRFASEGVVLSVLAMVGTFLFWLVRRRVVQHDRKHEEPPVD